MNSNNPKSPLPISRSFRDLSADEIKDPEMLMALAEFGWSGTFDWQKLLESERILILSEAGAGKTHECKAQVRELSARGEAAFFFALEALSKQEIEYLQSPDERARFQGWQQDGSSTAYFFLDSVDELKLSHGDFRIALRRLRKAIDGHLHRAKVVVTSRPLPVELEAFNAELPILDPPTDSDVVVESRERFRELISGEKRRAKRDAEQHERLGKSRKSKRTVALMPLSNEQISQLISGQHIADAEQLLAAIEAKRAWDLARRPQELIEICSYWRQHGKLGNRTQQVAEDIRSKLNERGDRKRHTKLSVERVQEGAERLALGIILTRKKTIRVSDLSLDDIEHEAALDPTVVLPDWSEPDREELLMRPLFGFASYGRVRFHHRSATEFLAAQRLNKLVSEGLMSIRALYRLIFGELYDEKVVFPSMRAVAAWLSLWNDGVRSEMIAREPEALMDDGDPESFSIEARNAILSAFAVRYQQSDWRGVRIPYPQVMRFAAPELSPTVRKLWQAGTESPEVRELLVDLIQTGRMNDCRDIALAVANDSDAYIADRCTAIRAIADMSEPGLIGELVGSLIDPDTNWPSSVKSGVIDAMFPKHMSNEQFCTLLSQIDVEKRQVGGLEWQLPNLFHEVSLDDGALSELRRSIASLIQSGIEQTEHWPHYTSKFQHLSSGLAVLCKQELETGKLPTADLMRSIVLSARFKQSEYGDEKPTDELMHKIRTSGSEVRKLVFIAESALCLVVLPTDDPEKHAMHIWRDRLLGNLRTDDFSWLVELASDEALPSLTADAAFWDALKFCWDKGSSVEDHVEKLCELVADNEWRQQALERRITPPKRDREEEAREAKWAQEDAEREAKRQTDIASWEDWREEVLRDPEPTFAPDKLKQTVWDFWYVLERDDHELTHRTHWNKTTIADIFSAEIADRVEQAFRGYWRTLTIPLRSERKEDERNTIWSHWIMGLAGVYAEATTGEDWTERLTSEEAKIAARYAPLELNGVPPWTTDLVKRWPDEVDRILGTELTDQLNDAASFTFPDLLSDFVNADEVVQRFFAPRVWDWLSTTDCSFSDESAQNSIYEHINRAIDLRLRHGQGHADDELAALVIRHLHAGLDQPFALLWVNALLRIAPESGIDAMEVGLAKLDGEKRYEFCENLFAGIGEQRNVRFAPNLDSDAYSPELLHKLLRLAYTEIDRKNDIDRVGGGTYSPTARDDAQRGRDAVLLSLLNQDGPTAWKIKLAMRDDSLFTHFRDRIHQLARETAAAEAEGPPLLDSELTNLDKYGEAPPADRDGIFALMMDRLSDLEHDMTAHEFSDRPVLAGIDQEAEMQVYLAKRLQERANNAYRIDREAMVVDAKETDIRLLSVRSEQQAVIEVKLGNNGYSVKDLISALEDQLVGKYMQHDNCRAGCLLITLAQDRQWKHPDTGKMLSFEELLTFLSQKADELSDRMGHAIRVAVFGLDFRP